MLNWLPVTIGAAAGAVIASALAYNIGAWSGEKAGRAAERDAARTRALDLIQKRSKDNAEITTMDAARLCGELGGRWVQSEDRCD